jgi:hypothetical protein
MNVGKHLRSTNICAYLRLFGPEESGAGLLEPVPAGDEHVYHKVGGVVLVGYLEGEEGGARQHAQHQQLHPHPPPVVVPQHQRHTGIEITHDQCSRSMTFWCGSGSGSADPCF